MENKEQQILSEIKNMMSSIRTQLELLDAKMAELQQVYEPQEFSVEPFDISLDEVSFDAGSGIVLENVEISERIKHFTKDMKKKKTFHEEVVKQMGETLRHRGPDAAGVYVAEHAAFAHTRLAVIDVEGGVQPMTRELGDRVCSIVYNGELYNTHELRSELRSLGHIFVTHSDIR